MILPNARAKSNFTKTYMVMKSIFLDNNSTTMVDDEVIEAMLECQKKKFANPASQHEYGRVARRELENARDSVSECLGLGPKDLCLFTSGGSEANNLAVFGRFPRKLRHQGFNLVVSAIEHPSILAAVDALNSDGIDVRRVYPKSNGSIAPTDVLREIDEQTRLVCCMSGNNETGVIQPVGEIASICAEKNIPFHVDTVQSIGKLEFDFVSSNFLTATVAPHKFHGPTGIGALLIRDPESRKFPTLEPQIFGGFQQGGYRPGTESIPLAVGFAKSLELAVNNLDEKSSRVGQLRDQFETAILEGIPGTFVNGDRINRLPHTTNISFLGIERQQFVLAADMQKLAVSTGSACSSGSSQPSHVLEAMGSEKPFVESAIRFGFSFQLTVHEIEESVRRISLICNNLRRSK